MMTSELIYWINLSEYRGKLYIKKKKFFQGKANELIQNVNNKTLKPSITGCKFTAFSPICKPWLKLSVGFIP